MEKQSPLNAEQMEDRLEELVDAALSSRRTATEPARQMATFERERQEFILHWVSATAKSNSEMAYQLAAHAHEAFNHMDNNGVEAWIIQAMDLFDNKGLTAGIASLKEAQQFARHRQQCVTGLALEDISAVLENFIHGLDGRLLRVEAGEHCYTDTEVVYLPSFLGLFPEREDNFRLYKAMAVHQWAQTWYGTLRAEHLQAMISHGQPGTALRHYHALETVRLDACIERELPGMFRDMRRLRSQLDTPKQDDRWQQFTQILRSPYATADDSRSLLLELDHRIIPQACCYQGTMIADVTLAVINQRIEQDKHKLRIALARLKEELEDADSSSWSQQGDVSETEVAPVKLRKVAASDLPENFTYELELGDTPIEIPPDVRSTVASIIQDLGAIPDDYLVAAGQGSYSMATQPSHDPDDVWKGTYHEEGAALYNEWDHARQHYRKNWCVLRERDVHPKFDDFAEKTLGKHRGLVKSLRRTFEALRGEDKLMKKQPYGEDIDIDALVEAYADVSSGLEMSDNVFTKMHKEERDIAVMFMVDMSGSTKGWINDAERETLILLCEALETLGDRYAIYGFSGMTRKRCELFRIKRFDEHYSDDVRARISGILPQDYTRMGVAIRHLSRLLHEIEARTKLLITLSDGKPDDYTDYRGEYGIEDTRQALFEARRDGIHPFCITIDDDAEEYLPHMYGAVNYVVINDVRKLPLKVSDIYRKLTT